MARVPVINVHVTIESQTRISHAHFGIRKLPKLWMGKRSGQVRESGSAIAHIHVIRTGNLIATFAPE